MTAPPESQSPNPFQWDDDLELKRINAKLMAIALAMHDAGELPNGPRSLDGAASNSSLFHLKGLAAAVARAHARPRTSTTAKDVEELRARAADWRRGVLGLTKVGHPVLRDAVASEVFAELRARKQELAALDLESDNPIAKALFAALDAPGAADEVARNRARQRLQAAQWASDLFRCGEAGVEVVEAAVSTIVARLHTGQDRLKTGPDSLERRLDSDAVHVGAAGFLSLLRHCFTARFIGNIVQRTNDGRELKRQVGDLLDALWTCLTGSTSLNENGELELLKCFGELLEDLRRNYQTVGRALFGATMAVSDAAPRAPAAREAGGSLLPG